jgi:HK97 family phage major capsid protein
MKTEKELLEARHELVKDQNALNKRMTKEPGRESDQREWDKLQDKIIDFSAQIQHGRRVKDRMAEKADGKYTAERTGQNVMGEMAFALASGKREARDGITFGNGSAAVSTDNVRNEIVEQLTANNRLTDMGARIMSMENYQVFPKVDTNPTVQHWEEGDQIAVDNAMVISGRPLQFKTVAVLVKVSKTWLLDSADRGQKLIGGAIMGAMNQAIINSALHGSTANKEPNGLDNITGILSIDGGGAAVTDYNLHLDATASLMAKNVQHDQIGYIQGTKSWRQTAGLVGTDGQPLMAPKAIGDLRNFHTTAVLENYGVGTDETRLYFGDFSNLVIGLGGTFKMELAEKYADTLQTAFLVWMRYDIQVLRPDNFCIVENLATA